MVDVNINPETGSKEITLSSPIQFYNALTLPIEIGFLGNGQSKESAQKRIDPNSYMQVPF